MAQVVAPRARAIARTAGAKSVKDKDLVKRMTRLQAEAELRGISSPYTEEFAQAIANSNMPRTKKATNSTAGTRDDELVKMLRSTQADIRRKRVAGDLNDYASLVLSDRRSLADAKMIVTGPAQEQAAHSISKARTDRGNSGVISNSEIQTISRGLPGFYADQDRYLNAVAENLSPRGTKDGEAIELIRNQRRDPTHIVSPNYTGKRTQIITASGSGKDLVFRQNLLTAIQGSPVSSNLLVTAILIENLLSMSPSNLNDWAEAEGSTMEVFFGGFSYGVAGGNIVKVMDSFKGYTDVENWRTNPNYFEDPSDTSDATTNFINMYSEGLDPKVEFKLSNKNTEDFIDYARDKSQRQTMGRGKVETKPLFKKPHAGVKPKIVRE